MSTHTYERYPGMEIADIAMCETVLDKYKIDIFDYISITHTINQAKGWFDQQRDFGTELMLVVTEVAEVMEAFREDNWGSVDNNGKPQGINSELADILIRVFDMCYRYNIDIDRALRDKLKYNMTRPYKHGGKAV